MTGEALKFAGCVLVLCLRSDVNPWNPSEVSFNLLSGDEPS